jgi:hypothetical protein
MEAHVVARLQREVDRLRRLAIFEDVVLRVRRVRLLDLVPDREPERITPPRDGLVLED